jgi:hypothetical protein
MVCQRPRTSIFAMTALSHASVPMEKKAANVYALHPHQR